MKNGPYEMVIAPKKYPGKKYRGKYCYEHHLVYWKHFGVTIKRGQLIHHKNENKRDNSVDNLVLITVQKHNEIHGSERRFAHLTHGTLSSYRYCRCEKCKLAKSNWNKHYNKKIAR